MAVRQGDSMTRIDNSCMERFSAKLSKANTSGYKGVRYSETRNKWITQIMYQRKCYNLGYYTDINDAIQVRKEAEKHMYDDFADWLKELRTINKNKREKINLAGNQYNHFKVIKRVGVKNGKSYWRCQCECGNFFDRRERDIVKLITESCGCVSNKRIAETLVREENNIDFTGKRYGDLEVLHLSDKSNRLGVNRIWTCLCHNCDREVDMVQSSLKRNSSCGCKHRELASNIIKDNMGIVESTNVSRISKDTIGKNNTSGVRGVSYHKKTCKWNANIGFKRKLYNLGYYDKIEDAIKARQEAEKQVFGEFIKWYNDQNKSE